MRPLSLTVRAAEPGDRYDRLNEVSFRQEVARVIESLPALFDGRYLRLDGGELSGTLTVPGTFVKAEGGWGALLQSRALLLPTSTSSTVDILRFGTGCSARVTVAMADGSTGPREAIWQCWISSSGDRTTNLVEDKVLSSDPNVRGTVYWKDGTAGATTEDKRTLVFSNAGGSPFSNQVVVFVEEFTDTNRTTVEWLV